MRAIYSAVLSIYIHGITSAKRMHEVQPSLLVREGNTLLVMYSLDTCVRYYTYICKFYLTQQTNPTVPHRSPQPSFLGRVSAWSQHLHNKGSSSTLSAVMIILWPWPGLTADSPLNNYIIISTCSYCLAPSHEATNPASHLILCGHTIVSGWIDLY